MKCPHCIKTFKNEKGVRMHVGRVHTKVIDNQVYRTHSSPTNGIAVVSRLPQVLHAGRTKVRAHSVALNFCPACGFDVSTVDGLLAKVNRQPAKSCAACSLPLTAVRTALRVAIKHVVNV